MSGRPTKPLLAVWRDAVCDSNLRSTAKLVLLALSTFMNGRGHAWPSEDRLAAATSLTDKSVHKGASEGEAAGFLVISRSKGRSSNGYQATLPPTANEARRSEWSTANLALANSESRAPNSERRSPESVESVESGAPARGALPDGSAACARIAVDECGGCGLHLPLVDEIYCTDCARARTAVEEVQPLSVRVDGSETLNTVPPPRGPLEPPHGAGRGPESA